MIHDLQDEAGRVVASVLLYGEQLERLERGETIASGELRAFAPWLTEGVPASQQIIKMKPE